MFAQMLEFFVVVIYLFLKSYDHNLKTLPSYKGQDCVMVILHYFQLKSTGLEYQAALSTVCM